MMKRALIIKMTDGTEKELVLKEAICLNLPKPGLWFEETPKGWKIVWSKGLIDDFTKVQGFEIRRED